MKLKLLIVLSVLFFNGPIFSQTAIDYRSLISKADLIYSKPVKRSEAGQPVGNGRMGTLVWTKPQALCFQINRVDVFSNNSNSNMFDANVVDASVLMDNGRDYCGGAGMVDIDFLSNEDIFSDSSFNQHLSCYDGTLETEGKGINTNTFVWNEEDVMAVNISDSREFQTSAIVSLRTLRQPTIIRGNHTAKSRLQVAGDKIVLIQEFTENEYYCRSAVAISIPGVKTRAWIAKDTEIKLATTTGTRDYTILISSAATFNPKVDIAARAIKQLDDAASKGYEEILASNKGWWHSFWEQSYVQLHSQDGEADYVSKNYAYYLYLMASTSRGDYPVKFNGMLWSTGGDTRTWGGAYWWANQNALYNPALFAANQTELMNPMFSMYSGRYESYALAASQQWGSKGIFIPETVGFDGLPELPDSIASEMRELYLVNKPWEERSRAFIDYGLRKNRFLSRWNCLIGEGAFGFCTHIFSSGAKIAYLYWMKYEFTLDKQWLSEFAYPMIKGIAEFYRNFPNMKKADDGKYHIYHVNDHETVWDGHNTAEEISAMMGILPVAIKASEILNEDAGLRSLWKELLQNLSPLPLSSDYPELAGKPVTFVRSLPPVWGGPAFSNTLPVWNFDLCTLESKDEELMNIARSTFDAFFPDGINEKTASGGSGLCNAGVLLGNKEAAKYLIPERMRLRDNIVMENRMDLTEGVQGTTAERLGKASEALQNALCQSIPAKPGEAYIIRVFPAWPDDWDAQFKLLARGNFLVSSSFQNGQIEYVEIVSGAGQDCSIRNPWGDASVSILEGTRKIKTIKGELISFQTKAGMQYTLVKK